MHPQYLTLLSLSAATIAGAQQPATLDSIARTAFARWNVPGMAVAVVRGDSVIFAKGYGVRALGEPSPVDVNTVFYTASVTKGFTVAAIASLADQGKLRASDPVTRHVPQFRVADSALTSQLTLLDLLGQRTGLPRADLFQFSGLPDSAVVDRLRFLQTSPALRGRLAYNNQMYQVLGEMAARLNAADFPSMLERTVLQPLGMTASNARGGGGSRGTNAASPHGWVDGKVSAIAPLPRIGYGAGAVNASANDLARWVRMLLNGGMIDGRRFVLESTIRAVFTPQVVGTPITVTPGATITTYGLGGYVYDYRGFLVYENPGQAEGWVAVVMTVPAARVGVVVLTNLNGTMLPQAVAAAELDALLSLPPRNWLGDYERIDGTRTAPAADTTSTSLVAMPDRFVGRYEHPMYGPIDVTRSGANLSLSYGTMLRGELRTVSDSLMRVRWSSPSVRVAIGDAASVRFRLSGGDIQALALDVGTDRIEFRRVPSSPRH